MFVPYRWKNYFILSSAAVSCLKSVLYSSGSMLCCCCWEISCNAAELMLQQRFTPADPLCQTPQVQLQFPEQDDRVPGK